MASDPKTTPEQKAALARYWSAETPQQQREAYAEMRALGLPAGYGEDAQQGTDPLVSVTDGSVHVEWHAHGLNIELRVRPTYVPWGLVEDARGQVDEYRGSHDAVARVIAAVRVLEERANGR